MKISLRHRWNGNEREKLSIKKNTYPGAISLTINLIWTEVGSNLSLRGKTPATNRMNDEKNRIGNIPSGTARSGLFVRDRKQFRTYTLFKFLQGNIYIYIYIYRGRDSSVGIVTCYGLDGPGIKSPWRRDFPHSPRPDLGPTQPSV
jgi:hypothetical protein